MDERIDKLLSVRERIDLYISLHLGEWVNRDMIFEGSGCDKRHEMNDHLYTLQGRYEYEDEIRDVQVKYENGGGTYVKHVKWFMFTKRRATRVPLFHTFAEKEAYMEEKRRESLYGKAGEKAVSEWTGSDGAVSDAEEKAKEMRKEIKEKWNGSAGISSIERDRPERLPMTDERKKKAQKQWQNMWRLIRTSSKW